LKFHIEKKISTGSFGTIYQVLSEDDDKIYALKELRKMDTVIKQRFEREIIQILLKLSNGTLKEILQFLTPIMLWNI
jgi:serine/threonine protein kinase